MKVNVQKHIDKASNLLENQRSNPLIVAISTSLAAIIYVSFKVQWFLFKLLFGEDACSIARNKLDSDFNKK